MKPETRNAALTDLGNGVGAGWINGNLVIVAGPSFEAIVTERRDGPRYVEAVRGADDMRYVRARNRLSPHWGAVTDDEREQGIPVGWTKR